MGTVLYDDGSLSVKQFYGGSKRGVCFNIAIKTEYTQFTQKEMCEFLASIIEDFVVTGEGIDE